MRRLKSLSLVGVFTSLIGAGSVVGEATPRLTSVATLGAARASALPDGLVVVSMDANGGLPGMVTLTIRLNAHGAITGGEWVLLVSSRQPGPVNPAAVEMAEDRQADIDEPGTQVATLAGTILPGGSVRFNRDGTVRAVIGAWLVVHSVTPRVPGIQGGFGMVDAADLHDYHAAFGTLHLAF